MQRSTYARWATAGTAVALVLLLAGPLAAYTIYMKDGTTVQAKEKYRVENGRAYIILPNGTQTFIKASEIDVKRTEAANQKDYGGNAVILEQPPAAATPQPPAPPPQKRLTDLASRGATQKEQATARRDAATAAVRSASAGKTKAGFPDLTVMARRPFPQADITAELQQFFHGQGVEDVEIYSGTRGDRPLVEVTASSEGSVFHALTIAANALIHVRDRFHDKVSALELLLTTPTHERAGQFVLTPEEAADLATKKTEVTAFYVDHVQF